MSARSSGFLESQGGIPVPGAIVTIEPHRSEGGAASRVRMLLQAASGGTMMRRDIVVWDEAHERQLYRDGPYDSITVQRRLEKIVAELNLDGVHQFLLQRGGGGSGTVTVVREMPQEAYEQAALAGLGYYWDRVTRMFRRRP